MGMYMRMAQGVEAGPGHVEGEEGEEEAGDVGGFAHPVAEAGEAFFGALDAPRGGGANGDHGEGEAKAEGTDNGEAEGHFFKLEAYQKDCEGGRTWHEAAGDAKHDDLRGGDAAGAEAAGDVFGVGALVGVLIDIACGLDFFGDDGGVVVVFLAGRMIVGMGGCGFGEFETVGVGVVGVAE
ncbi:MAG: hypothetical protein JWR15_3361, partial [Prosthecobacter sp.]|nr:hypothetical protein [Prosthecobacter sp.]